MHKIFKCPSCNNYTLQESCSKCKVKTLNPRPAKYSVEDKFGKYRRMYKEKMEK
ncbi:MAG: nucleolar RNA-binding Nop10p family protein [Candidatus Nanoarchaeia archaeon]|nr:nucleolar RNA-binding Nop10p family protein [Candidatus Nanoarchaeia archaeon]MDD5588026.1 nucleolar RNA-binding Nop10p family protein [Candidatus Nanoarchaeia archaeon]